MGNQSVSRGTRWNRRQFVAGVGTTVLGGLAGCIGGGGGDDTTTTDQAGGTDTTATEPGTGTTRSSRRMRPAPEPSLGRDLAPR